eukprot:3907989-Amphidinium_carterae.1
MVDQSDVLPRLPPDLGATADFPFGLPRWDGGPALVSIALAFMCNDLKHDARVHLIEHTTVFNQSIFWAFYL